ncbi:dehydrogenase/reductase SDR family member 2, mitochondrial-like [Trichechus manatus latirostris]|uniref:Dehydrogenase/reductase SDR family member 2, mitochondrial-like n=1 Tax=Trichechus manatus latirostris TaxID=127582 RepID=A0A2Y9QD50_TRIMA|nr:dehydrogenase/reductase SDR family member 2, mitochondrial-like [Trichechus manatus latirostris]
MLGAALWTFGSLLRSSVCLSVKVCSSEADRSRALVDKMAVITGSTESQAPRRRVGGLKPASSSPPADPRYSGGVDFLACNVEVTILVGSTLGASDQVWDKIMLTDLLSRGVKGDTYSSSPQSLWSPGLQMLGIYNTSKTLLLGLIKSLAVELAPKGIWVNCLSPALIKMDFSQVGREARGLYVDCVLPVLSRSSNIVGENIVVACFSLRL